MEKFLQITFLNPEYFWGLLLIPIILYFFYKRETQKTIFFTYISSVGEIWSKKNIKFYLSLFLLFLILVNFIIILANPNITNISKKIKKNGIDIVVVLDVSWSMEANDLQPNRLEVAKSVINNFVDKLKSDRLWLVVFAWKPFTSIPLTFDYNILKETISRLKTDTINQQKRGLSWTAVWDAILMAKTLFKNEKKDEDREKIIILLTDWDANVWVDPVLAWLSVKKENIKIYAIWIWSKKWWFISYNFWPFVEKERIPPLNDKYLKKIASDTNWLYFRAENNDTFKLIFDELSKLQKDDIEIEVQKEYSEYYDYFIYSLIILILAFSYLIFYRIELKK